MKRFSRLLELRRIKEEAAGQVLARALARVQELHARVTTLEEETAQGRAAALTAVGSGSPRLPPGLYEDYYRGQAERRRRLEAEIAEAQQAVARAREGWQAARVELKQAESLSQKAAEDLRKEERQRETRALDQMGSQRHHWR